MNYRYNDNNKNNQQSKNRKNHNSANKEETKPLDNCEPLFLKKKLSTNTTYQNPDYSSSKKNETQNPKKNSFENFSKKIKKISLANRKRKNSNSCYLNKNKTVIKEKNIIYRTSYKRNDKEAYNKTLKNSKKESIFKRLADQGFGINKPRKKSNGFTSGDWKYRSGRLERVIKSSRDVDYNILTKQSKRPKNKSMLGEEKLRNTKN